MTTLPANSPALSAADQAELVRLLAGDHPFIDHPTFHEPDAERRLFTDAAPIPAADTSWFLPFMHEHVRQGGCGNRLAMDQETAIFLQFNYCRCRVAQFAPSAKAGEESAARELLGWHRRAVAIRESIINHTLELAAHVARHGVLRDGRRITPPKELTYDEVISEVMMALILAVDHNDVSHGFRFSTYLVDWVRTRWRGYFAKRRRRGSMPATTNLSEADTQTLSQVDQLALHRYQDDRREETQEFIAERVRRVLDENLAGLTSQQRIIINEHYTHGLTYRKLALMFKRSYQWVYLTLHAALRRLRLVVMRVIGRDEVSAKVIQRMEARQKARRRGNAFIDTRVSVWGVWLLHRAKALGMRGIKALASAAGLAEETLRYAMHRVSPGGRGSIRSRTRDALCRVLGINEDMLLNGWRDSGLEGA